MQTGVKQVFYFAAGANALGGYLGDPQDPKVTITPIPTPCSVSLSPTGGEVLSRAKGPGTEKDITFTSAYTYVVGKPSRLNGPWTHRVVSVVEGLNLLGRVKADRLVAQVMIEHPGLDTPDVQRKISFSGSHFENLQVDGKAITPTIHPAFFPANEATIDHYDTKAWTPPTLDWSELSAIALRQGSALVKDQRLPEWARARYSWVTDRKTSIAMSPSGYTLCSLVDGINGLASGPTPGHFFDLPEFGRVFLGEAVVHPHALNLAMVRVELGCRVTGQASAANVITNGETCPPN